MNGFAQHYHGPTSEQRLQYSNTDFKTETYDMGTHHRGSYSYPAPNPYSEQELAESLGWVDYSQNGQTNIAAAHQMQLTNEMNMQHASLHNRAPSSSLHQAGSLASTGTYGSVNIPQASNSPAGWHSSMDSPNFLADPSQVTRRLSLAQHPTGTMPIKKEGSSVAEKKAMRRYSHNAVERRRRDNINEQIQELAALVFDCGSTPSPRPDASSTSGAMSNTKPNKGIVLRKSVECIRLLRSLVDDKSEREKQLEVEILRLGGTLPEKKRRNSSVSMWVDESAIVEDDD